MLDTTLILTPIDAKEALHRIQSLQPLRNYHVLGKLDLATLIIDDYRFIYPVLIENCRVEHLSASGGVSFECAVTLLQTHFIQADFIFAYFLQGLHIEGCTFDTYLDFQAGGHNKPGFPVCLLANEFSGFVNFFDCCYEAEVVVEDNVFRQGTNLLGRPFNIPVTFDVPLRQARNIGDLSRNDEGEGETSE
ncbi:hypothetical protein [Solirubrum puertoriconensis]|uniref:Uncharacterized protein n=1 Tax=Solirubrum puertoriconensis TaxID=1751427 RepID=A0A9X0HID9_SOLP1|nr:hypothetical protein [Solirubrum puertoriconensis]KUG06430.1 hypothetical protein ASU33_03480 [Solirubrum puertoriconensis]